MTFNSFSNASFAYLRFYSCGAPQKIVQCWHKKRLGCSSYIAANGKIYGVFFYCTHYSDITWYSLNMLFASISFACFPFKQVNKMQYEHGATSSCQGICVVYENGNPVVVIVISNRFSITCINTACWRPYLSSNTI